ncbi:MAG: gliding motility lipoprotein GldD [Paludibacteraceae bacterium]|nr:gliding motility lipoprotein GldD [Paludibacteraceae bacterium]
MKRVNKIILSLLASILMCACSDYMPKPKGYFRIDLPEKSYKTFHKDGFPCSFEYADNVSMVKTSDIGADSVWIDVIYPKCNARIYGTYRKVEGNFNQLSEEAYRLVYQPHVSKADGINTSFFGDDDHKVYGMFYELKGNTASNIQFAMSDSTHHFLRGALYFNANPNKDSIAPVVDYIKEDIINLINTLEWK